MSAEGAAWLPRAASARPDHPALLAPEGALTYLELYVRASAAAARLAAAGVARGDRVALDLPFGLAFAVALHACLLLGAPAVPVDPRLGAAERAARRAGATAVLDDPEALQAPAPVRTLGAVGGHRLEDPCLVVHTSGTSGPPRRVELTYANWLANALGAAAALGADPAERWLDPLPVAHVGGLGILVRSAILAATAELAPFDAETTARTLAEQPVTLVSLVPTQLARLLDAGLRRPRALRAALIGGAPIPPVLLERARAAGVPVAQSYGMTETCSMVAASRVGEPASAGAVVLPGALVRTADDGELLVGGPAVAPGCLGPDGLLRTGDLGRIDAAGRLHLAGRKADTIITGGENVAPAAVEAVLAEHPSVAEAGVFARPDPEWGEAVVAAVVARPGARLDPEELRRWARSRLAGFQAPKAIEVVDALPRTASGKLLRRQLAAPPEPPAG